MDNDINTTADDELDLSDIFDNNGQIIKSKDFVCPPEKRKRGRPQVRNLPENYISKEDVVVTYNWSSTKQKEFVNFSPPTKYDKDNKPYWEYSGEILFSGAVGSSKSFSLCLAILRYIMIPNTKVLLCRLNLSDLRKSTLKMLLEDEVMLDGNTRPALLPRGAIKNFNKMSGIIYLHNGSQIIMSGASNIEKIRSINVSAAFVEELSELSLEQYLAITQRCRTYCGQANIIFSCTNPKHKGSWLYTYFKINEIPNIRKMINVTVYDNKRNVTPGYIKQLEKLPEPDRSRMLLGEWTDSGDMVFYSFDREKHIRENLFSNKYDSYILGQDFGGGAAECGMCLIGIKDNVYYCLKEFVKRKTSHSEALEWLEQYRGLSKSILVYDSANAAFATDAENREWKLIKSIKDLEGSFVIINDLFSQNRLFIDSSCKTLINQIEGASRTVTGGVNKSANWDVLDSWRYACCALQLNETSQYAEVDEPLLICFNFNNR